ncbi:MAG: ABC transporter permease [Rhodocyclaceae bacterium]|nr:ABC transporter permease [Rhodocyclaceae bacterium]
MLVYVFRRLLLMVPTLAGITLVVFVVMAASPGGLGAQALVDGSQLEPQARAALEAYYNRRYGLDQPPPVQYLRWLNAISPVGFTREADGSLGAFSFFKGSDLGESFRYGRPVSALLAERVPITLLLNLLTIPLIYVLAIAIGVRAAARAGGRFDVASNVVLLGLWSVPSMLAGVLLIGFFASAQYWHWFPTGGLSSREALQAPFLPYFPTATAALTAIGCILGGTVAAVALALRRGAGALWVMLCGVCGLATGVWLARATGALAGVQAGFLLDRLWHLALPVLVLSYGGLAFLAKLARSAVLENLAADYARTARAKGVAEADVLWRHVFRNSLLPLITVSAGLLPGLLAGSVVVESLFGIDGMGKLAVEAVQTRDRELVLSVTLVSGVLTLVGYLLADLAYALADPRVSYD